MFSLGNKVSAALARIQAAGQDFSADLTKRDDLKRAVYVGVSFSYLGENPTFDAKEVKMVTDVAKALYPNFDLAEIRAVITEAATAHQTLPELGFIQTEE